MKKLIVLGTGNGGAMKCYNTCFAVQEGDEYFLVDGGGGNGIMTQLERAEIDLRNIHEIFVSHNHSDHILGIVWVIRKIGVIMRDNDGYEGNLVIYASDVTVAALKVLCEMLLPSKKLKDLIGGRIILREVKNGQKIVWAGSDITFFDVLGRKDKQFGFQMQLSDGKMTFCGDEPLHRDLFELARGSKWLLHEVWGLQRDEVRAKWAQHCTTFEAGEIAQEVGAQKLVLWHTTDKALEERKERYSAEVREKFGGEIFVPDDLEVIEL